MTNKTRLFKKSLLAVTITTMTMASSQALAAGFQLNSQSATGLGRAFAGDAVIADNASVMARNAAGMALFDSSQFSAGVNYIETDIEVSNINDGAIDDANNSSGTPVPNIYYIHRLNDQWAFGAGIYSNFGTTNNFDDSFGGSGPTPTPKQFGGTTEVVSINYALTASYRINEQWSVGAGLDIIQGSGKLIRDTGADGSFLPGIIPQKGADIDVEGYGLGWNAGAVFELDERNRFGFSYHYSPEIEADGDMTYLDQDISNQKLLMPLPSMAEFSGYHEIENTKFAVHYSVQWIGWSAFDKLETSEGIELGNYQWQDGWHYAIGGTYFLDDSWTLRAGYMYDTAAQDEVTSISVPDSDRQWFSAGFSYAVEQHTIDFGFTYLLGDDVAVEETGSGANITATTHADAILAGIQYSYSF